MLELVIILLFLVWIVAIAFNAAAFLIQLLSLALVVCIVLSIYKFIRNYPPPKV